MSFAQISPKYRCFKQCVWTEPNTTYRDKHLIPAVQHDGGELMIWASSPGTRPWQLSLIGEPWRAVQKPMTETLKPSLYFSIYVGMQRHYSFISLTQELSITHADTDGVEPNFFNGPSNTTQSTCLGLVSHRSFHQNSAEK